MDQTREWTKRANGLNVRMDQRDFMVGEGSIVNMHWMVSTHTRTHTHSHTHTQTHTHTHEQLYTGQTRVNGLRDFMVRKGSRVYKHWMVNTHIHTHTHIHKHTHA
jgi:hypothetical protein